MTQTPPLSPHALDTSSSASRQHYIDTGRYLTHAEVAEFASGPALSMTPTLFLAWLSHPEDGGWFSPQSRDSGDTRDWRKAGPLHLSLHTREEHARAALLAACQAEWERAHLSYAHGPWDEITEPVTYMVRHIGYDAHVTEQPVDLP